MKKCITYLFGAGASCKTLPILREMPGAMANQMDFLNNKEGFLRPDIISATKETKSNEEIEYLKDLSWLKANCQEHASVDTFARKLYINGESEKLLILKNCLSAFLLIEQLKKQVDVRYDTFFANVLESKYKMPDKLKIISWNYDMQFEMSYQAFVNERTLENAQAILGVYMKYNDNWRANGKFGIYKLNGSSIAYHADNSRRQVIYASLDHRKISPEILQDIFNSYCIMKTDASKYISGLSFAWERGSYNNSFYTDILTLAKKHTIDTEVLVIIGYSIPFFNREIDREIIGEMSNLKKVYFQDLEPNGLIERFTSIRDDIEKSNLIPIKNCDQFFIPNEM